MANSNRSDQGEKSRAQVDSAAAEGKAPRTERGRRTLRKLLDASAVEFGEKGFHEASVSSITRRAGVALGSFYTYFDSKDALFRALVQDMSENVRTSARSALKEGMGAMEIERAALAAFLAFAREHKEIYRIIDEAEFVDPESYRNHYETIAGRIRARIEAGAAAGELRTGLGEIEAWAIMGMNVFVGLRYAVWGSEDASPGDPEEIAAAVNRLLAEGIERR
ncbi:DNA-binding transcriptional regulator, AcrR family [Erythrobacter litoralis]|jgi:AcrR family transcriptional regulator|uniref:TetR family transcriptional regulator n=1 Tax=Erythrobacter litoralis TaxID=39960 RepID=A0A074N5J4_9SPHN|nr:TetR/AcrR family transcriptional regulator [Erythrobacter litoralis]AOL24513.1 DNA-binding transcriptional regulator, AcrR family [Erythrobacter litoralis]KEO93247.1 TetR family transcriptional regulator [Erythrobacter litoralis]MEE4338387.1 TetR/AcrR family transcriptional regulator [Erythrobacter sp.]